MPKVTDVKLSEHLYDVLQEGNTVVVGGLNIAIQAHEDAKGYVPGFVKETLVLGPGAMKELADNGHTGFASLQTGAIYDIQLV